jgi:hypothetical protein
LNKIVKTYGYHGETLSNLIQLSDLLTIESKKDQNDHLIRKEFQSNKEIRTTLLSNEPLQFKTVIKIENLFGKYPIRQRQLAETNHQINKLIKIFDILSLINYKVEIVLENEATNRVLFESRNQPDNGTMKTKFCCLFSLKTDCHLIDHSISFEDKMKISGFISKKCLNEKLSHYYGQRYRHSRLQFIYINRKYIRNNDFYEIVAKCLQSNKHFNSTNCQNDFIFCLVIDCPFELYSITKRNNCELDQIEVRNDNYFNDFKQALSYYVDTFLANNGFDENFNKTDNCELEMDVEMEMEMEPGDLKTTRLSKHVKYFIEKRPYSLKTTQNNEIKSLINIFEKSRSILKSKNKLKMKKRIKNRKKFMIKLNKTAEFTINKQKISQTLTKITNKRRLNISIIHNKVIQEKEEEIKKNIFKEVERRSKCVQTIQIEKESAPSSPINDNWIEKVSDDGIKYYLNILDGTTAYNLPLEFNDLNLKISNYDPKIDHNNIWKQFNSDFKIEKFKLKQIGDDEKEHFNDFNNLKKSIKKKLLNKCHSMEDDCLNQSVLLDKSIFQQIKVKTFSIFFRFYNLFLSFSCFNFKKFIGQLDCKFIATFSSKITNSKYF